MFRRTRTDPIPVETAFTINNKPYKLGPHVPLDTTLNVFIRQFANLRGTKFMCFEGGCGTCIVAVTAQHPVSGKTYTFAVNSCLLLVYSCHGWAITTVEGLGSKAMGYHLIQKTLAHFNGTQCGYCSPGMVMNMYGLMADKKPRMEEVENSFGGSLCRCTGYRPILDAFKSLAIDASPDLLNKCPDVEDLDKEMCPKIGKVCPIKAVKGKEFLQMENHELMRKNQSEETRIYILGQQPESLWYKVSKIDEIYHILWDMSDDTYMFVGGNTAQGVYRRIQEPKVYIDINGVEELRGFFMNPELMLGGNMSLTEMMDVFRHVSQQHALYKYATVLADHIDLIANVPVRNTGTLAGNLATKFQHQEFPSDIYLMLETVNAKIHIGSSPFSVMPMDLLSFLNMDMDRKLIHGVSLPPLDSNYYVQTYKIMPRAQNAHAYVNAGFCFKLNMSNNGEILEKPNIVYGGINPQFIHAVGTESYLKGKQLFDVNTLQNAFRMLDSELKPDYILPDASPEYRKGLAKALLYKFVLSLKPPGLHKKFVSGGFLLQRPLSSGKQEYQTDKSEWPLNKPVPKIESLVQCAGEAEYVDDIPAQPGELFGAFVLTKVGPGTLTKIDPTPAFSMPGVIAFVGAKDIPGKNNFTKFSPPVFNMYYEEEIFCSGHILFAGQPVGVIVAETRSLAIKAAGLVKLEYGNITKPILTIEDAINSGDPNRIITELKHDPVTPGGEKDAKHILKGQFHVNTQYHFTMESQTCLCVPVEDGMNVYPSTQWMDLTQRAVAECLAVPQNTINVQVKRLGGGYGSKISRNTQVAAACALASNKVNRPVRIMMQLEDNMEAIGKRYDCRIDYEVGVNDKGKITYMKSDMHQNSGSNRNESCLTIFTQGAFKNCYDNRTWGYTGKVALTDLPSNTYCRAPGSLEGMAFIENIMEHIACKLDIDPVQVRIENMDTSSGDYSVPEMINYLCKKSDYDRRKLDVEQFNKDNRWKKRGISLVCMTYPIIYLGGFSANVSIFAGDGTVSVCHGGIEIGQGINTKVAQACAHFLNIPLEMVTIKASNTMMAPNGLVTGASITSETCCYATMRCCEILMERLTPIKREKPHLTWKDLVSEAYNQNIDLFASYMFSGREAKAYDVYGVAIAEVEIDILTGQKMILRVDILEDAGKSLSPKIDVGQVEGAFMMGLGMWTSEELVHDPESGRLLTTRSWNYKPPGVKDIPIDFHIELRRDAPNPYGILRSKATGEPAISMSCVVLFALRQALNSARKDAGDKEEWYPLDNAVSNEKVFLTSLNEHSQYLL